MFVYWMTEQVAIRESANGHAPSITAAASLTMLYVHVTFTPLLTHSVSTVTDIEWVPCQKIENNLMRLGQTSKQLLLNAKKNIISKRLMTYWRQNSKMWKRFGKCSKEINLRIFQLSIQMISKNIFCGLWNPNNVFYEADDGIKH